MSVCNSCMAALANTYMKCFNIEIVIGVNVSGAGASLAETKSGYNMSVLQLHVKQQLVGYGC